jgi:hypothetical protein
VNRRIQAGAVLLGVTLALGVGFEVTASVHERRLHLPNTIWLTDRPLTPKDGQYAG